MEYGKPACPNCTMPGCVEEGNLLACVKRTRKRYEALMREKKRVEDRIEAMRKTHWGISMKALLERKIEVNREQAEENHECERW